MMLATAESMSLLVTLNLVFAVVALAVGFVAGAWFGGNRSAGKSVDVDADENAKLERQRQIERERAAMATDRLRDLASGVATDLGDHSARVGEITADLQGLDTTDIEATGAGLVDALAKIVAANETLQDKLDKAEEQIAAQAQEIHLHESEARTDSLTGLANRRAFDDEMKRRFAESRRHGMPLTLLILDIDFFKKFNDTYGHQAGDEVLRSVGRQLEVASRDMDLPCRYGGEEFAIVMPATQVADGAIGAERIRKAVESMTVEFEGQELKVTTSVGLAQLSTDEDIAQVLRRADEALYASKGAGRNCGHYHDGSNCMPIGAKKGKPRAAAAPPEKKVKVQAITSTLDALSNRTRFAEELRRRMAESNRTEQPIAVVVAQLQQYDELMREYGPEAACTALDGAAQAFETTLREMDLLARLSEDRFCILLPENDVETAMVVAERTGHLLAGCPLKLGDRSITLTLGLGAAEYTGGDSVEDLVGRAEAGLGRYGDVVDSAMNLTSN